MTRASATRVSLLALSVRLAGCAADPDCAPDEAGEQQLTPLWADADADGYTTATSEDRCVGAALPDGWLAEPTEVDCDDTSAAVNVRAPDIVGDGVDQDCDGADAAAVTATEAYVDAGHPACQDEVAGTREAPNCTAGRASKLVVDGATIYVASGPQTWWFLQVGRTYLGGRNPTDWTRDPGNPTVMGRADMDSALQLEGAGEADTVMEGFQGLGDAAGIVVWWFGPGKLTLRDVDLQARGGQGALWVWGGEVIVEDSTIDAGDFWLCTGVWVRDGIATLRNTTITGCGGATEGHIVSAQFGTLVMSDVTVDSRDPATDAIGVEAFQSQVFLTGVRVHIAAVHDAVALLTTGPDTRVEVKESALVASSESFGGRTAAAIIEGGGTLIAANSAFDAESPESPAIIAEEGAVTLVNTQVLGGATAFQLYASATAQLVANNFWSERLSVLVESTNNVTSVDDLNACGWDGCGLSEGNTAHDPDYLVRDNFEVSGTSRLIDRGVDPSPYGLIVDRDIVGNPSPSDGDGDGRAIWDVGPYER